MNCQNFNERLYDYLDNTLPGDLKSGFQEHLQECDQCRQALLREKAVAQSMRCSLNRATAGLSLHPQTLRNPRAACEPKPVSPNSLTLSWDWFISNPLRTLGAGAALLGALWLLVGVPALRHGAGDSGSQAIADSLHVACVIDVPIQTQSHLFRRQNGAVVDAVSQGMAVARAGFSRTQ